jgi:hypothetical protein
MDKDLEQAKQELKTETAVVGVVKTETSELSLRSVAKVKARLQAYETVYTNYEKFIKNEAEKLADGKYAENTYKELGIARLIAHWVVETERFLEEEGEKLQGAERETRKGFVEESLKALPEDIKSELLGKLNEKKHEVLEWFAKELQLAQKKANERRRKRDDRVPEAEQG